MNKHKYILEPYRGMNTRYRCPSCQQRNKTFSRYIDTETGAYIHPNVGRCNRESNCGHHYAPKQYFKDNGISDGKNAVSVSILLKNRKQETQPKPISFIPVEVFKASLRGHEANHFVKFLIDLFGVEVASELVSRYFIATSKHWSGATVFWQIDIHGKVRTGKIMLYNPTTGKRVKELFNHINWVHKAIKQPEFELKQCLFGEHLLIDKTKPVAIVESEKTAIIASVYLPQFIWLAVGSLTNLNAEKCSILKGRTVSLFPDLNGFEKWSSKAKEISRLIPEIRFIVSDLLERKTTEAERQQGLDLADYLTQFDYREFRQQEQQAVFKTVPELQPVEETNNCEITANVSKAEAVQLENWTDEITELENYFTGVTLPAIPVKLSPYSTITNCSLFIESHFATLKANNGKTTFLPFLHRLQELKQYMTVNYE